MLDKHYILDENKNIVEVDLITWAQSFENQEMRRVGRDVIKIPKGVQSVLIGAVPVSHPKYEKIVVSTVFLGLDHNFSEIGPPILFETMVFGGKMDQHMERCATYDEALKMHERVVKEVKKAEGVLKIVENKEKKKHEKGKNGEPW